jgi:hypothetical protein
VPREGGSRITRLLDEAEIALREPTTESEEDQAELKAAVAMIFAVADPVRAERLLRSIREYEIRTDTLGELATAMATRDFDHSERLLADLETDGAGLGPGCFSVGLQPVRDEMVSEHRGRLAGAGPVRGQASTGQRLSGWWCWSWQGPEVLVHRSDPGSDWPVSALSSTCRPMVGRGHRPGIA